MDFELGEDVAMLADTVRALCQREIVPNAAAWDEAGHLPPSILRTLGEVGLLGMRIPESRGGAGLSMLAAATLVEELAAADGAVALTVSVHNFGCLGHLQLRCSPEVQRDLVPKLASGEALGAWALAEPGVGSDAGGVQTTARHEHDVWVLEGRKSFVVQGGTADHVVVVASTDPVRRDESLAAFVVDRGTQGLVVADEVEPLGMRAAATVDLSLEGVRVPTQRMLGHPGQAHGDVATLVDDSKIAAAAIACGLARAALTTATAYAKERQQFGRPIASFQAIQWKLADMAMNIDAARLLVRKAAWLRDHGEPVAEAAAQAKLFAASKAVAACSEALQIHGGYGYTREFPVERLLRDARLIPVSDGTDEIQRIVVSEAIERRFAGG